MGKREEIERLVEKNAQTEANRILQTEKCDRSGFVYLLYAKGTGEYDAGRYKIGRTIDISKRYSQLRYQSPYEIKHLATFWSPNAVLDEKLWHMLLSDKRVYNEWFEFNSEDILITDHTTKEGDQCHEVYFHRLDIGYVWHSCILTVMPSVVEEFLSKKICFFMNDIFLLETYDTEISGLLIDYFKYQWNLPTSFDETKKESYLLFEKKFIDKLKFIKTYTANCKRNFRTIMQDQRINIKDRLNKYFEIYDFRRDIEREVEKM